LHIHPCFSSITKKTTLEFNLWAKIFSIRHIAQKNKRSKNSLNNGILAWFVYLNLNLTVLWNFIMAWRNANLPSKSKKNLNLKNFIWRMPRPQFSLLLCMFKEKATKKISCLLIIFYYEIIFTILWRQYNIFYYSKHSKLFANCHVSWDTLYHYINILNNFLYLIVNPYYELLIIKCYRYLVF